MASAGLLSHLGRRRRRVGGTPRRPRTSCRWKLCVRGAPWPPPGGRRVGPVATLLRIWRGGPRRVRLSHLRARGGGKIYHGGLVGDPIGGCRGGGAAAGERADPARESGGSNGPPPGSGGGVCCRRGGNARTRGSADPPPPRAVMSGLPTLLPPQPAVGGGGRHDRQFSA